MKLSGASIDRLAPVSTVIVGDNRAVGVDRIWSEGGGKIDVKSRVDATPDVVALQTPMGKAERRSRLVSK